MYLSMEQVACDRDKIGLGTLSSLLSLFSPLSSEKKKAVLDLLRCRGRCRRSAHVRLGAGGYSLPLPLIFSLPSFFFSLRLPICLESWGGYGDGNLGPSFRSSLLVLQRGVSGFKGRWVGF